jgi:hypothetical protein
MATRTTRAAALALAVIAAVGVASPSAAQQRVPPAQQPQPPQERQATERPEEQRQATERDIGGVGITVFEDTNFRGATVTFRENVPDLGRFNFNDKISSLRVAGSERWEVCEDSNFRGRCITVSGNEPDLTRNGWNDRISSLRRVTSTSNRPMPPSGRGQPAPRNIVLFDQTRFRGGSISFNSNQSRLSRRAGSVSVSGGVWEICDRNNFGGRCVRVDRNVSDLGAFGFPGRIASLRLVQTRPR